MRKNTLDEAVELSQKILEKWFRGEPSLILDLIDDDVLWIGSTAKQFYQGKEEVIKAMQDVNDSVVPCTVTEQVWSIPDKGANYCVCVGRYICTLNTTTMLMQEPQRVTVVWKKIEGKLKIKHIHLSNVMHTVTEDKEFPIETSKRNYDYVQKKLSRTNGILRIRTTEHEYHLMNIDSVIYVEASRNNIIVHTVDENYRIHHSIGDWIEKSCPNFIFIHRSYAVNPTWIKIVTQREVVLGNDERIIVPRKRYKEVRDKLKELFG